MNLNFNFDETIDRRGVPALKTHPVVLGAGGEKLFAAGVADMDFAVAQPIVDAMSERVAHRVFGYEAVPDGMLSALMGWLETRHGWSVTPDTILRAPNVLNALAIAASLFAKAGEGIIIQPPVFFDFYNIIEENHRKLIKNPLRLVEGRYEMDFPGLEALASDPRNKILFLCNPHNPVGRVWNADELRRLGKICRRHGVLVVSDELHGDIVYTGHKYVPFASLGSDFADNSITFVSPAKSFNIAGCCHAFSIIADETRRKMFQAENSRLTVNKNNAFASVAMLAAYRDGAPWLDALTRYLEGNIDLVRQKLRALEGVDLIEPEGTFLLWLDFRQLGLDAAELDTFLRQSAGWAVTRGVAFGEEGAGFARLNIACPRNKLMKALARLAAAINGNAG